MARHSLTTQSGLSQMLKDFRFDPETPLDDKFEVIAHLFLEHAVEQMFDMSSKDAMIGAGIAIDKMQLLRGLPTEIRSSIPILIQIALKASEEKIELTTVLTKLLNAMSE